MAKIYVYGVASGLTNR